MTRETLNEVEGLVDDLRRKMELMWPGERLTTLDMLMRGCCRKCGVQTNGRVCECDL